MHRMTFVPFFSPDSFCTSSERGVLNFLPKSPPFQLPDSSFCDTYNPFHYANDLDTGFSRVAWRSCKWLHTKQPLFVLLQLRIPRCIIKGKQEGKTHPPKRHLIPQKGDEFGSKICPKAEIMIHGSMHLKINRWKCVFKINIFMPFRVLGYDLEYDFCLFFKKVILLSRKDA